MKGKVRAKQGLTLLELLVVIAIIVALWALIFAALAPVRERARQAVCINHLRQIGHAIQMYRQDYGGSDVPGRYFEMGLPPNKFILARFYMGWKGHPKVPEVWSCPDIPPEFKEGTWAYTYQVCDDLHAKQGIPIAPCFIPIPGLIQRIPTFKERIEKRGDQYALFFDPYHDFPQKRTDPRFVIVLRLGGHIDLRFVPRYGPGSSSHEW